MKTFKVFNLKKILTAALYILAPLALGFATSMIAGNDNGFYSGLNKPPFAPPAIVFPIVWSVLYVLMGIAFYISRECDNVKPLFYVQLAVNYAWTFLFFRFHLITFAAVWIALLLVLVIINTIQFFNCKKAAGYLMIPYIIWLLIALYLNIGIVILN